MAVTATVEKFGMEFSDAYHRVNRLTYESSDLKTMQYGEPSVSEEGMPVAPTATEVWTKRTYANFEVSTYASAATREAHAEPIYRTYYNVEVDLAEGDLLAQAYAHLKAQAGYEDAVDC